MMVKICGITNSEDAQAAAGCGASALGFNFYPPSPRYILPEEAALISAGVPGVLKVGVFVNAPAEEIARIVETVGLDVVQLHGDEDRTLTVAARKNSPVWKAMRVNESFTPAAMEGYHVEAFVLDAPSETYGGSGRVFDWAKARRTGRRIVLAGGLDEDNVAMAIEVARPWGVDACSRLERAPGRKDHGKIARFIKAAVR